MITIIIFVHSFCFVNIPKKILRNYLKSGEENVMLVWETHKCFYRPTKKSVSCLSELSPRLQNGFFSCLCCHEVMNRLNGNNGANGLSLEKAVTVLYSTVHSGCDRAALWRVETERSREKSKPCPISQSCTRRPSHSERRWPLVFPVLFFLYLMTTDAEGRWESRDEIGDVLQSSGVEAKSSLSSVKPWFLSPY